jgi:hypothetical protein
MDGSSNPYQERSPYVRQNLSRLQRFLKLPELRWKRPKIQSEVFGYEHREMPEVQRHRQLHALQREWSGAAMKSLNGKRALADYVVLIESLENRILFNKNLAVDDFANAGDYADAYNIPINPATGQATVTGTINTPTDSDLFHIRLPPTTFGGYVGINVEPNPMSSLLISVTAIKPDGSSIEGPRGGDSLENLTFSTFGSGEPGYYDNFYLLVQQFDVGGPDTTTGTYTITYAGPQGQYVFTPPTPPATVRATDGTFSDKVRVTWSGVSEATSYRVYRALQVGGPYSPVNHWQSGRSFNDTSVRAGKVYYYKIRARNEAGAGRKLSRANPGSR